MFESLLFEGYILSFILRINKPKISYKIFEFPAKFLDKAFFALKEAALLQSIDILPCFHMGMSFFFPSQIFVSYVPADSIK